MGGLLGIPEWLAVIGFVAAVLLAWLGLGDLLHRRQMLALAKRRQNPNAAEFVEQMTLQTSREVAHFMWEMLREYTGKYATPHPTDHLFDDLYIDQGDVDIDWPEKWAERRAFEMRVLPNWPSEWETTVLNFGRWLDMAYLNNSSSRT